MISSFVISLTVGISILSSCRSWNIDTRNPVIISDLFDGTDSLFGASVALLGDTGDKSSSPASSASSWVIVGAPKANSTHSKQKSIFEPGVTWRCSLGRNPEDFCEVLVMDPTENKYFQQGDSLGEVYDRKDEGWLGGSMFSSLNGNGDQSRFVSCANRWQNQWLAHTSNLTQHYMMNGICYWRPTSHLRAEGPVPELPHNYRLLPLKNQEMQAIEGEFIWVFGQSGFSLHITNDNQMILGAPGISAWKGGVIHLVDKKPASLRRNGSPDEFGGVFGNMRVSSSKLNDELNHNNSYFGYAVTSGNFIRSSDTTKTQFVAGAPRGNNLQGKVVVFTFPQRGSYLNILQEINGTKIGSYFGSVLCSVDINNDGLIDLLIGAPQYSTRLNPKLSAFRAADPAPTVETIGQFGALVKPVEFGDEGRVFVYISSGTELVKQSELNGGNEFASRFGNSISSIGDINSDGFNDVAIGAPYENDGRGAVYIYLGNSDGLSNQYAQVIYGEDLSPILYGFGYSLSQGVDIDGNGYNDLGIGSLISAQTVILRTRPIVTLSGKITTTLEKLPLNSTQFQFQACVSFTGKHAPVKIDISIKLTMDIDSKPPRVHIRLGENNSAATRVYTFKGVPYGRSSCETMTAIILQPLVVSGNPITIKTEMSLIQEVKTVEASFYSLAAALNGFPKLTRSGPRYEAFCKDCPIQDSESSKKASFFSLPLELPCGSDNKCVSDIRLSYQFLDASPGKGFVIGSKSTITLQISMENFGEAALSPSLKISWKKLNLHNVPSNCEPLGGSGGGVILDYLCKFGEILAENSMVNLTLVFDAKDLYANGKDDAFECVVIARTTSEMSAPVRLNLELPFVFEGDIFITSKEIVVPLSSESLNPYQYFTHSFEVGLTGLSSVEFVGINFSIPVNLIGATDEPIVEITNLRSFVDGDKLVKCIRMKHAVQIPDLPNEEQTEEEEVKIKLEINAESELVQIPDTAPAAGPGSEEERNLRRRREAEDLKDDKNPEGTSLGKKLAKNGILVIDCSTDYVTCETFTCELNKFKPNSQASFDFTLKISSESLQELLKEEKAQSLHVRSKGKVEISSPPAYKPPSGHQPDEADAITKFELDLAKVAQWVYMASFGGGIIGLICLIFCFYACGCFERKKKPGEEESVENREVSEQSKPLQSQTIPEEDENESQPESFSREETASPEDRPNHYYFSR